MEKIEIDEISRIVDERIAAALGVNVKALAEDFDLEANVVAATPSVLSIVRATAYAMC